MTDTTTAKCLRCDGCGQVANSDDQEPWTHWANLPRGSDVAVRIGLVKPIPCPKCGGSGTTTDVVERLPPSGDLTGREEHRTDADQPHSRLQRVVPAGASEQPSRGPRDLARPGVGAVELPPMSNIMCEHCGGDAQVCGCAEERCAYIYPAAGGNVCEQPRSFHPDRLHPFTPANPTTTDAFEAEQKFVDAVTVGQRADLRNKHKLVLDMRDRDNPQLRCPHCLGWWPCPTLRLLANLEFVEAAIAHERERTATLRGAAQRLVDVEARLEAQVAILSALAGKKQALADLRAALGGQP